VALHSVVSRSRELTSPHQRCDGKRPCTTCVNGERGAECTYEPRQPPHRPNARALPVSHETTSHPRSARALPPKPPATGFSFSGPLVRPSLGDPLLPLSNSSESASSLLPSPSPPLLTPYEPPPAPSSRVCGGMVLGPSPSSSVVWYTHDTMECVLRPPSSFTVLPSIHLQAIHRPLRISLSLIPPERVQVSSITGGDFDMSLYVLFRFLPSH